MKHGLERRLADSNQWFAMMNSNVHISTLSQYLTSCYSRKSTVQRKENWRTVDIVFIVFGACLLPQPILIVMKFTVLIQFNSLYSLPCWYLCFLCIPILMIIILMYILIESRFMLIRWPEVHLYETTFKLETSKIKKN